MRNHPWLVCFVCLILVLPCCAQNDGSYRDIATPRITSDKLSSPDQLRKYVVEGKLKLTLRDAVVLTLENNSLVRVEETQVDFSRFSLLGAHSPFDPLVTGSYNANNTTSPPFTTLGSTGVTLASKSIIRTAQINYSETFETGTNIQAGLSSSRDSFNASQGSVGTLNPYVNSLLNLQFTQPLLRNGWWFANTAPLVIARRNLEQSKANFAAEVSNSILEAANEYWAVVEARGSLDVAQRSMDAAETSYKRDKRALESGPCLRSISTARNPVSHRAACR